MTAYFAHELRNPLHAIDIALSIMPSTLDEDSASLVQSMKVRMRKERKTKRCEYPGDSLHSSLVAKTSFARRCRSFARRS